MARLIPKSFHRSLAGATALLLAGCAAAPIQQTPPLVATYSIVAFDPATGDLGVAVQSKFFGVGSVVPWAKAEVGAVATQSFANTDYGPRGLAELARGRSPETAIAKLTQADAERAVRQVGIVDAEGRTAAFTGERCHAWAGHLVGTNFTAQGNLLASGAVVTNMARAFEAARASGTGELAEWLTEGLFAAEAAGGDRRGRQSAALLVVRKGGGYAGQNDRYVDLRVEDHPEPLEELRRLLKLHRQFYRPKAVK